MKVAIVHDQLQEFGGAERVLVSLKKAFPQADVYTSFYNPESLGIHQNLFKDWKIYTSWTQKVPLLNTLYSPLRFITPLMWEGFNFNQYDVVISSSGSYMCKGIVTRPETLHICYLHHPPRYLYYYETAIEWQKHWPIKAYGNFLNHGLRQWDYISSQRVDYFIANSHETNKRIEKFYRRDGEVIYPPVATPEKSTSLSKSERPYYLTVSRLARAKHIDILIEAANAQGFELKIVGAGRDASYLQQLAGPTVEFLGPVSDSLLPSIYANARAYLFASVDEEFGIAPMEAMGYGIPVIAYASGGLKETVKEGHNGFLVDRLSSDEFANKVTVLDAMSESEYVKLASHARSTAEKFTEDKFISAITTFVDKHKK